MQIERVILAVCCGTHDRLKRIDDDNSRRGLLDLLDNAFKDCLETFGDNQVAQIDKAYGGADLCGIEEGKALLMAENLNRVARP